MPERESTSVPYPREARSGLGWLVLVVCVFCSIAIQARAGEEGVVSEFEAQAASEMLGPMAHASAAAALTDALQSMS